MPPPNRSVASGVWSLTKRFPRGLAGGEDDLAEHGIFMAVKLFRVTLSWRVRVHVHLARLTECPAQERMPMEPLGDHDETAVRPPRGLVCNRVPLRCGVLVMGGAAHAAGSSEWAGDLCTFLAVVL